MNHTSQMTDDHPDGCSSDVLDAGSPTRKLSKFPMQHIVTVCTAPIKDGGTVPRVDVYITFTGQFNDILLTLQIMLLSAFDDKTVRVTVK